MRAIIVDDEELARTGLAVGLRKAGGIEIVAVCGNGRDAIAAILELAPDVVFLDVEMPGTDGLGVIESVGDKAPPHFVLVTAHDRYAIRAFEVNVLDYLLKPISEERLAAALKRVGEAVAREKEGGLGRRLSALLREAPGKGPRPDRFVVRSSGRVVFVKATEIDWVEAQGDYVSLHVGKRDHLLRETLTNLERSLDPQRFARIHRSTIVNVDSILELRPQENGEYVVLLRDGSELKLSRNYRDPLQALVAGRL